MFQPYPARVVDNVSPGRAVRVPVSGLLEVNGVSRPATFNLQVLLDKNEVAAAGATTVAVEDFAMDVPQAAGGFVAVDPHITLEVSLVLLRP